eukprot:scaffold44705_cov24-Tisochrysis_lutea.AAC.2
MARLARILIRAETPVQPPPPTKGACCGGGGLLRNERRQGRAHATETLRAAQPHAHCVQSLNPCPFHVQ